MARASRARHLRVGMLAAAALATVVAMSPGPARATAAIPPAAVPTFNAGVDLSPHDVWLVGSDAMDRHALARHWDGSSWQPVTTPNPGDGFNDLFGVDGASADDVWAVGAYATGTWTRASLAEHWDGTSWAVVPVPDPEGDDQLLAVSVVGPRDVWAMGMTFSPLQGFLLHWNGKTWTMEGARSGQYFGLSADSDHDVWTIYNGHPSRWNNPGWTDSRPLATGAETIAAVSPTDVWAGGALSWRHGQRNGVAHFDGETWTEGYAPSPGYNNELRGSDAVGTDDIWAAGVGYIQHVQTGQVLHWDGSSWSVVLRRTSSGVGWLNGIVASGPDDAWAFGNVGVTTNVMHWDGHHWKRFAVE